MRSKWIKGYEGLYMITNEAIVISYCRNMNGNKLKPHHNKNGYLTVELTGKEYKLHRLVAEHFVDGKQENLVVNHKDGNKLNCLADNLEWVTSSENTKHAYDNLLCPKHKGPRKDSRTIIQSTVDGQLIAIFYSLTYAAIAIKPTNVKSAVSKIKAVCEKYSYNGYVRKTAYGFKWSYK